MLSSVHAALFWVSIFNSLPPKCQRLVDLRIGPVYYLYPETSGVRLEDMNVLFGDATTAMPTPATQGEQGSLMGAGSPVSSLDIRRQHGQFGAESAIPGLDINPPTIPPDDNKTGRAASFEGGGRRTEGIGGWISSMINQRKGSGLNVHGSQYRRLGQEEQGQEDDGQ